MSGLIKLKGVDVRFGAVQALSGIDLRVAAGERLALIGSNGSGKSTLLRVLHGLVKPVAGSVLRDSAARQAMVFQRPHMLRTSALNNVALGLWIAGERWRRARERALLALGRVGLGEVALRSARALSGGQQQRLALARAWSLKPDVLFLDEPTSSLDPHAKREVESLMAEFAEGGMTLVFASHNLGQVKRLATRVVYLEHGRVLADLPVNEFFNGPRLVQTSREADLFVKGELA
ncbi:phosphate ABC transporter ATP-binding protein [Ramlibacter sp. WS9]|uniref:ABC transporter ATP-binding protein n=1 Tax=Ramlibacter sp. WS9 TaxID=1882741 RepID=UPI00114395DC|nr:phosphate ABC transporter ATP-binding protein [Ramlibacter sp. WS9]ROZ76582.1 phosphate ABC transporter ATP-binding protein [Ramlibacter sp. WS9]